MPQFRGYGDDTTTYIRTSKIPSHIYILSISIQKYVMDYTFQYEYNYKVITRYGSILQEYYITDRCKCENTKRYTIMNSTQDAHKLQKENLRDEQWGLEEKGFGRSADDPRFRCATMISNRETPQAPSSGIWTCRSKGVKNSQTSGMMNAKWHAGASTHVSINLNQNHALKTVLWTYTPEHERGIKWWDVYKRQNQLYELSTWDWYLERIIQTRKPSSIYYIPHVFIDWVRTTRIVHNNSWREQYE